MYYFNEIYISFSVNEEYNGENNNNDEYNNENSEDSQLYNENNISNNENNNTCTEVYNSVTYELTCAEYLIPNNEEEKTEEEIEKEEKEEEYKDELIETVKSIKENQEELLKTDETLTAIELYESMNEKLESIYDYLSLFIGLYFIGWIFSQLNTWRRNNK